MRIKMKGLFSLLLSAALVLAMTTAVPIPAQAAATVPADYLDENGDLHTEEAAVFDGTDPSLTTGWYVVNGNVSATDITINGEVKLILGNNRKLTVNGSGANAGIYITDADSLTIYAQSTDENLMGELEATGGGTDELSGAGIGGSSAGTLSICGGIITATGNANRFSQVSAGIGGGHVSSGGAG